MSLHRKNEPGNQFEPLGQAGSPLEKVAIGDRREARRFTSLIKAAKITFGQFEAVCVIRDVSTTGVGLRLFHDLPAADGYELVLPNGLRHPIRHIRSEQFQHSFAFEQGVDLESLVIDAADFAKRQLRVAVHAPATVTTNAHSFRSEVYNLSQQGALLQSAAILVVQQPIKLEVKGFSTISAKVRWTDENYFGLAFDDTFTLKEFAVRVALLQGIATFGQPPSQT